MRAAQIIVCAAGLPAAAVAGGIDRSGQPIGLLFQDGNKAEIEVSYTDPELTGRDLTTGQPIGDIASPYWNLRLGLKTQATERFSVAVLAGEDFASDLTYPGNASTSAFGGTIAQSDSFALSVIGRYAFSENWAVHAGVRANRADGQIALGGQAYGFLNGYDSTLGTDLAFGYLVGGTYEIPGIALRAALTYFSPIVHQFPTTETFNSGSDGSGGRPPEVTFQSGDTRVELPQAINFDLQTGIGPRTIVFGSVRWVEWSAFKVKPREFTELSPPGLVNINDTITYALGAGHQITDRFSGSVTAIYEPPTGDDLVSPLSPRNGFSGFRLGARYKFDAFDLSGHLRYLWLGDAKPETADTARADFRDNHAVTIGAKISWTF